FSRDWSSDVCSSDLLLSIASRLPCAEARKHRRKLFGADIEVFANASPQHGRRNVPAVALRLRLPEHVQHDSLLASESVADVRQRSEERRVGKVSAEV